MAVPLFIIFMLSLYPFLRYRGIQSSLCLPRWPTRVICAKLRVGRIPQSTNFCSFLPVDRVFRVVCPD